MLSCIESICSSLSSSSIHPAFIEHSSSIKLICYSILLVYWFCFEVNLLPGGMCCGERWGRGKSGERIVFYRGENIVIYS